MGFALAAAAAARGARGDAGRGERRARAAAGRARRRVSRPPRSWPRPASGSSTPLRRAVDGGRRRRLPAGRAGRPQAQEGREGVPTRSSSSRPRTCWPALAGRQAPGPGDRRVRGRARRRRDRATAEASSQRKGLDAIVVQRHLAAGHRLRRRAQRGRRSSPPTGSSASRARARSEVADAVLDEAARRLDQREKEERGGVRTRPGSAARV